MAQEPFAIRKSTSVPNFRGSTPEYADANAALSKLKVGEEIDIPYSAVKQEHARTVIQRAGRKNDMKLVTRAIKDKKGEATGLRVYRVAPAKD